MTQYQSPATTVTSESAYNPWAKTIDIAKVVRQEFQNRGIPVQEHYTGPEDWRSNINSVVGCAIAHRLSVKEACDRIYGSPAVVQ